MSIIICILLIIFQIANNQVVLKGAQNGLMLWYQSILPLLLPFMLISAYIVSHLKKDSTAANGRWKHIAVILFLGIFCGYPIGAKTTAAYIKDGSLSKQAGNRLLPLCNNFSPIFLSGYIVNTILNNKISFIMLLLLIYLPYILMLLPEMFISRVFSKNEVYEITKKNKINHDSQGDIILQSIIQITYIGIYIMLCSILIELLYSVNTPISDEIKPLIAGIIEVTNGAKYIISCTALKQKTALILSITSFGGISSMLQTKKVIENSGLSIIRYTIIKACCAISTYMLTILIL